MVVNLTPFPSLKNNCQVEYEHGNRTLNDWQTLDNGNPK